MHFQHYNNELLQNPTEKQIMPFKTTVDCLKTTADCLFNDYDVIWSLVVLTEKMAFFNKQLKGFILSLSRVSHYCLFNILNFAPCHTKIF